MKNSFGNNITLTIFGESHGVSIGAVLDGIAPGIEIDYTEIERVLTLRRPAGLISTPRQETDEYTIHSGVFENKTTGTPICITIKNNDTRSKDYSGTRFIPRPSHADYAAFCKYHGFEDYRGGGHQSGRITAALVLIGGILLPALKKKGIYIGSHIASCGDIKDRDFDDILADIELLNDKPFATLDCDAAEKMQQAICEAKAENDSIGGTLETAIFGLPAGLGEPWFDTVEGLLSHAVVSVPGVKGIEFGAGFSISSMRGSTANDSFIIKNGEIATATNNAGGINGGICNGMPVVFKTAFRPTPTISREQDSVDMDKKCDAKLLSVGRHDPFIVHRARIVVDSLAAFVVADLLCGRYGTDWLAQ